MKKIIISFALCFTAALGLVLSTVFTSDLDENLHTCCIYPTILVCDEYTSHGSGAVVRSEKVGDHYVNVAITCDHVVQHGNPLKVYVTHYGDWSEPIGRTGHYAFIYATNRKIDMTVLVFETSFPLAAADIDADTPLYMGSDIVGAGCSQLAIPRIDYGKITQITNDQYRSSMVAVPGDSGGPVYHNYKLIGIKRSIAMIEFQYGIAPIFDISHIVPIHLLYDWSVREGGNLDFVFDNSVSLPPLVDLIVPTSEFGPQDRSPFEHTFPSLP